MPDLPGVPRLPAAAGHPPGAAGHLTGAAAELVLSGPAGGVRVTGDSGLGAGAVVDQAALGAALDRFVATVADVFTAADVLAELVDAVVGVLGADGAGVMVADPNSDSDRDPDPDPDPGCDPGVAAVRGRGAVVEGAAGGAVGGWLRFSCAAGPARDTVTAAGRLQELLQEGPCHDSHRSGRVVDIADLASSGTSVVYRGRAAHLGLRALTAVPLLARGRGWGTLEVYWSAPRRPSPAEVAAAATLAGLATSYLVIAADRLAAERVRAELAHRATHDPLTGLPLRAVLVEHLSHALARLQRHPGHVGVLFVDIDGLKYVNDTHGHAAGDQLLRACADRVRAMLRPQDVLARVGGDEFLVLLEDLPAPAAASDVAHRLLTSLGAPHRLQSVAHHDPGTENGNTGDRSDRSRGEGVVVAPSASVGVATSAESATTPQALIAHADSAMYRAKRAGRGRVDVFDPGDYEAGRAQASTDPLLPALALALTRGELVLHYQPVYDLTAHAHGRSGPARPHAVEALLRWNRPGHGLVPAGAFLHGVERTDLMLELGAWALHAACTQAVTWDAVAGLGAPATVLVNISALELADPALPGRVAGVLARTGLAPSRLVLEVTETALITDLAAATTTVAALSDLGCALAIDDFGTGYSSLRRLVDIPATTLKVDRSFTRDLHTHPAVAAVITAVVALGRTLGRTVVVEGVEDAATSRALLDLGATVQQGYHHGRPAPAQTITTALLRAATPPPTS